MMRLLAPLALVLLTACAHQVGTPPSNPPPPVPATSLITYAQPFDSGISNPADMTGKVAFVWEDKFGAVPAVATCHYAPAYRSNAQTDAWFDANHPDWVMRTADQWVAYEFGNTYYIPLDISNPTAVAFIQAGIKAALKPGQTWICLDNIDAENSYGEAGHFSADGAWVDQYTGQPKDPKWQADNVAYLTTMAAWAHTNGLQVMINNAANSSAISAGDWDALADTADGVMMEGWPIDDCEQDPPNWIMGRTAAPQFDVEYAEAIHALSYPTFQLSYFCGHPLAQATNDEIAWVTAVRLLTASSVAADNLLAAPGAPPQTDDAQLEAYPTSMNPMIGPVTDPPPFAGSRPYTRAFANGFVALNPTAAPLDVTLPAGVDQFGAPVAAGVHSLAPMTAIVVVAP